MSLIKAFIIAGSLLAATLSLSAQTPEDPALVNTSWRAYYASIQDTLTLHFFKDSSVITTSTGATVLQSTFKWKKKIIVFHDYGGMNGCPDEPGSYHVHIDGNTLMFEMDEDPCDGRGGTLIAKKWIKIQPAEPANVKR